MQPLWPVMASSDFGKLGHRQTPGLFLEGRRGAADETHDPAKGFRLYLQQREAGWMPRDGEHINVSVTDLLYGSGAVRSTPVAFWPGLACYTPRRWTAAPC